MRDVVRILAAVLLVVGTACSSAAVDGEGEPAGDLERASADATPTATTDGGSDASAETPGPDTDEAPNAAVAESGHNENLYPQVGPGEVHQRYGDIRLDVELSHACATPGTIMEARIVTVPDARLAYAVRYHDNEPHGDWGGGRAPTGELTWTWTVKPTVPEGTAQVHVIAGKPDKTGAHTIAGFEVAAAC